MVGSHLTRVQRVLAELSCPDSVVHLEMVYCCHLCILFHYITDLSFFLKTNSGSISFLYLIVLIKDVFCYPAWCVGMLFSGLSSSEAPDFIHVISRLSLCHLMDFQTHNCVYNRKQTNVDTCVSYRVYSFSKFLIRWITSWQHWPQHPSFSQSSHLRVKWQHVYYYEIGYNRRKQWHFLECCSLSVC